MCEVAACRGCGPRGPGLRYANALLSRLRPTALLVVVAIGFGCSSGGDEPTPTTTALSTAAQACAELQPLNDRFFRLTSSSVMFTVRAFDDSLCDEVTTALNSALVLQPETDSSPVFDDIRLLREPLRW